MEHIHYKKWPDGQLPNTTEELDVLLYLAETFAADHIKEQNKILKKNNELQDPGKLCVHCKGGYSRTGTFIALINAIISIKEQKKIGITNPELSVFSIVRRLREQRFDMVDC